jgi:hypothetical protein
MRTTEVVMLWACADHSVSRRNALSFCVPPLFVPFLPLKCFPFTRIISINPIDQHLTCTRCIIYSSFTVYLSSQIFPQYVAQLKKCAGLKYKIKLYVYFVKHVTDTHSIQLHQSCLGSQRSRHTWRSLICTLHHYIWTGCLNILHTQCSIQNITLRKQPKYKHITVVYD